MRDVSVAYVEANLDLSREPRFMLIIENDNGNLVFTSHDDVTPTLGEDDQLFPNTIVTPAGNTQQIQPEKGFSSIGNATIELLDVNVTEALRALLNDNNDTIVNNKAILYTGFAGLDTTDYLKIFPYYVEQVNNDDLTFTLRLVDAQRFTKKTLFRNRPKTELSASIGLTLTDTISVQTTDGFDLVEHGPEWTNAPNTTVGYLILKGNNANGVPTKEYVSYTGKGTSPTRFTGVTRGLFGTDLVDGIGNKPPGEGNTEVQELVYLDMPIPKMILALLTGDLYGQPGQTLPEHWHAGVIASQVDLSSFENVGSDLWNITTSEGLNFEFIDLEDEDAKVFIFQELMRVCNLFLRINQDGELALSRFTSAPTYMPGAKILSYDSILEFSGIERDAKAIRNIFAINWEYRKDIERYMRSDTYVDSTSQQRNNLTSAVYSINLRGARNSSREVRQELNALAEGIRARYSEPAVKPRIQALLRDTLELEVGDIVTLDLDNHPDYASAGGLLASFEIQGISYDFSAGTATFDLFGSSGDPVGIEFGPNDAITDINHPVEDWTDITTVLTGTESGGVFTVTENGDLPAGKYFYNGTFRIANDITITVNETVTIDAYDIDMVGTAKIDGRARGGSPGQRHYFGGQDSAQEGIEYNAKRIEWLFNVRWDYRYRREGYSTSRVAASNTRTGDFQGIKIDEDGFITGLPDDLAGNGSKRGETSHIFDDDDGSNNNIPGGAAVNGGAGLCLICDNLFVDPGSVIDLSGSDNNQGSSDSTGTRGFYAGGSGFGWPGALLVLIKNPASPLPILDQNFTAKTGNFTEGGIIYNGVTRRPASSGYRYDTPTGTYWPRLPDAYKYRNTEYAPVALKIRRVFQTKPPSTNPGVDPTGPAQLPDEIMLSSEVNVPPTPLGNLITVTVTATEPDDEFYSHSDFAYRLKDQYQWIPIEYGIRNEATVTVIGDGSTYEFSARSVSTSGQISTGRVQAEITVPLVSKNTGEGDASPLVPPIKRLELVNRIDEDTGWDKWKGPDAIIRWAKLSTEQGGNIVNERGVSDLHLIGYKVRVAEPNGRVVREEIVTDATYVYSLEKNRKDNIQDDGSYAPLRNLVFSVQALASTGYTSETATISVSNPPPALPSDVTLSPAYNSIGVTFTLPTDLDFVGVDLYVLPSSSGDPFTQSPVRVAGNSFVITGLATDETYRIGLISVDQFGPGVDTVTYTLSTIPIVITDLGDITEPLTLDESGGRIITNNSGYIAVMGAVNREEVSESPLIFHAWDGSNSPLWVDANGHFGFGIGANSITFNGTELTLNEGVSLTFTTNKEVTVGTGGDFETINEALEFLSRSIPGYKATGQTQATVTLLSGYEMREQILVFGLDLSWITIVAESTVNVYPSDFTRSILPASEGDGPSAREIIAAIAATANGVAPEIIGTFVVQSYTPVAATYYAFAFAERGASVKLGTSAYPELPNFSLDCGGEYMRFFHCLDGGKIIAQNANLSNTNVPLHCCYIGLDGYADIAFSNLSDIANGPFVTGGHLNWISVIWDATGVTDLLEAQRNARITGQIEIQNFDTNAHIILEDSYMELGNSRFYSDNDTSYLIQASRCDIHVDSLSVAGGPGDGGDYTGDVTTLFTLFAGSTIRIGFLYGNYTNVADQATNTVTRDGIVFYQPI